MKPEEEVLSIWEQFSRRHEGNPFLKVNPLYSIPEPLIDIIAGKQPTHTASGVVKEAVTESKGVAPGFLTKDEVAFERDLARTLSGGFFHEKPFFFTIPGVPETPPSFLVKLETEHVLGSIRGLKKELLQGEGLNSSQLDAAFAKEKDNVVMADTRSAAYAGWLVTDKTFQTERDKLRHRWDATVQGRGRFLVLPGGQATAGSTADGDTAEHEAFLDFYCRWGLETFLTWDLPFPACPSLAGHSQYSSRVRGRLGVELFLPWYVYRHGQFDLQELSKDQQVFHNVSHLKGWFTKSTAGKKHFGDTRLCTLLVIFLYQNLAIESRYEDRKGWNATRQDTAFSRFLSLDVESIRKIRLHLQNSLPG